MMVRGGWNIILHVKDGLLVLFFNDYPFNTIESGQSLPVSFCTLIVLTVLSPLYNTVSDSAVSPLFANSAN